MALSSLYSAFLQLSSSGPRAFGHTGRAPMMKADEGRMIISDLVSNNLQLVLGHSPNLKSALPGAQFSLQPVLFLKYTTDSRPSGVLPKAWLSSNWKR